jgi:hypothetical protein
MWVSRAIVILTSNPCGKLNVPAVCPQRQQLFSTASSSSEEGSKPARDGFLETTEMPVIENGHLTVRDIQVAVVVSQDVRQARDRGLKIGKRPRELRL